MLHLLTIWFAFHSNVYHYYENEKVGLTTNELDNTEILHLIGQSGYETPF